jgi:hypothetical protein
MILLPLKPENQSPEDRPPKGTLYLVVKDDGSVVLRNYLGVETTLGTAPDAG